MIALLRLEENIRSNLPAERSQLLPYSSATLRLAFTASLTTLRAVLIAFWTVTMVTDTIGYGYDGST